MATCRFRSKCYDHESETPKTFNCQEEPLVPGLCIFHDKYYPQHYLYMFREQRKENVRKKLKDKINYAISNNEPLKCIGYFIPPIKFAKLTEKGFSQPVYFNKATFYGADFSGVIFSDRVTFDGATFSNKADFRGSTFSGRADFNKATFSELANFNGAKFSNEAYSFENTFSSNKGETRFNYITFEQPNKVTFAKSNLSKVSFHGSDITRIRFDEILWGGKDKITIIEEQWLKEQTEGEQKGENKQVSLEDVLPVYRNLRENYEFRLRYDDAGKFFIKEMELKRKYRTVRGEIFKVKENGWFRRNLSLTGLYHNLFVYGEDLKRPALMLLLPLFILSAVYWGVVNLGDELFGNDNFARWFNATARTALDMSQVEREHPDLVDSITKTATLAILGTLLIPLRRKFERKYTRG